MHWAFSLILVLDNVQRFSSNSTEFSVVIENAVGYNYLQDGPMDAVGWKMQNGTFSKFHPKNQVYFSLNSKDQKH